MLGPIAFVAFACAFLVLCFTTRLSLNWQIALGALAGLAFGIGLPEAAEVMKGTGTLFVALLKMLIAPLILLTIVHGISSMGEARELGRLGSRTIAWYLVTMALAAGTGLVLVNLFRPGAGSDLANTPFLQAAIAAHPPAAEAPPLAQFLFNTALGLFENPVSALASGHVLPIVAFAVLLGVALLQIGPVAQPLVDVIEAGSHAVMRIIGWFVRLAPLGISALIGHLVATTGVRVLVENLLLFSAVVVGGTLFHAFVILPALAWYFGGVYPSTLFHALREALLVAFTTSSSAATIPVTTRCVEQGLGVPRHVSSFVIPLGATVNMDGTALYEAIAAIFVANLYGFELSLGQQVVVFLISIATAIGAPGIPSAGMVTMVIVLEAVGLPGEAVGLLLTVDRLLDTVRTMANVEGDAVVAAIVTRKLETG